MTIDLLKRAKELLDGRYLFSEREQLIQEMADALEAQARRMAFIEAEKDLYHSNWQVAQARIAELEHEVQCWHEAASWPEKSPKQLRASIAELKDAMRPLVARIADDGWNNVSDGGRVAVRLGDLRKCQAILDNSNAARAAAGEKDD